MPPVENPLSRKDNLVIQEINGETLVYDLVTNKAFCLNETSALVWQACDGSKSTAEVSEFVSQKLNSPANEDLVWLALDQLKKEKLIENGESLPNHFAGMSRREVIKKVGLGTMFALPIVASVVAPTVVDAASIVCTLRCTTISGGVRQSCNCNAVIPVGQRDRGCLCNAVGDCCPGLMCSNIPNDGTGANVCNNGTTSNI